MGVELYLTERLIALGVRAFLIDPRGRAMRGNDGDLVQAAGRGNHVGVSTDDGVVGESLNEGVLEFIGNKVAAFGVGAFLQCVAHLGGHIRLGAGLVPERLFIDVGGATGLGVHLRTGIGLRRDRDVHGLGQLGVHLFESLHASDLIAERGDLGFHAGVGRIILCAQEAFGIATGLQKRSGRRELLSTLIAQFDNRHVVFPP